MVITNLVDFHRKTKFFRGRTKINLKLDTQEKQDLVKHNGVQLILMCDSWIHRIKDAAMTAYWFRDELSPHPSSKKK